MHALRLSCRAARCPPGHLSHAPVVSLVEALYVTEATRRMAYHAAIIEGQRYGRWTRVREIVEIARRLVLLLGRCVGHDSATMAHLRAPAVCVVAKDRVLVHNTAAALHAGRRLPSDSNPRRSIR